MRRETWVVQACAIIGALGQMWSTVAVLSVVVFLIIALIALLRCRPTDVPRTLEALARLWPLRLRSTSSRPPAARPTGADGNGSG